MSLGVSKPSGGTRLAIGLPVYNGENFLEAALQSILSQTFSDFELIISDNASTDRTEELCRACKDSRVRYYRNDVNIGAAPNFNRVFELSDAEYFKWIAHDDMHEPGFVEACINALDEERDVVLAYTRAMTVDWSGKPDRVWGGVEGLSSPHTHERLRASLVRPVDPLPLPLFGVVRSDILARTRLQAGYPGCDRVLLSELCLYGRFREISAPLFLQREHKHRAGPSLARSADEAAQFWTATGRRGPDVQFWQQLAACVSAVFRAPLGITSRIRCTAEISKWVVRERQALSQEVVRALETVPVVGGLVQKQSRWYRQRAWKSQVKKLADEIESTVPAGEKYILVDEDNFSGQEFHGRHPLAFPQQDGQYWGLPASDEHAIEALEAAIAQGARYLVISWPAFWWLTYYEAWARHIEAGFTLLSESDQLKVYQLASHGEDQSGHAGRDDNALCGGDC